MENHEYRWQWLAICPGTGEDEVDSHVDIKNGFGTPLVCEISPHWYDNKIYCLRMGLERKEHVCVPEGYDKQLLIHVRPKTFPYPQYSSYQTRLDTFKNWPKYLNPPSDQLAAAGFFYRGVADKVTCFWCKVTLKHWEPKDTAWKEHKRHSPQCPFVNMCKELC